MSRLTLLLLLGACSVPKGAPAPPRERDQVQDAAMKVRDAASGLARASEEPRRIHIAVFDCERQESFPGMPPQAGLVVPGAGIRGWQAGGPDGASWNIDDLRCTIRVKTTCTRGDINVALRVGRSKVVEKKAAIGGPHVDLELIVPFKKWKGNFDDQKPAGRPFDTAVMRAFATLSCTAPYAASGRISDYRDVTDEDMFVAGFAYGE